MLRKEHKERAQPGYRAHMGLLEKKKDYTARAKDFGRKKGALKDLKRKAEEKNPDEFNFRMVKTRTKVCLCVRERERNEERARWMCVFVPSGGGGRVA